MPRTEPSEATNQKKKIFFFFKLYFKEFVPMMEKQMKGKHLLASLAKGSDMNKPRSKKRLCPNREELRQSEG